LRSATGGATADDDVRVIGITGAGDKAFRIRPDLSEVLHRDLSKALSRSYRAAPINRTTPKPTIAAINGICFGGGPEVVWL
jgi:enoyl-CoA hydratase